MKLHHNIINKIIPKDVEKKDVEKVENDHVEIEHLEANTNIHPSKAEHKINPFLTKARTAVNWLVGASLIYNIANSARQTLSPYLQAKSIHTELIENQKQQALEGYFLQTTPFKLETLKNEKSTIATKYVEIIEKKEIAFNQNKTQIRAAELLLSRLELNYHNSKSPSDLSKISIARQEFGELLKNDTLILGEIIFTIRQSKHNCGEVLANAYSRALELNALCDRYNTTESTSSSSIICRTIQQCTALFVNESGRIPDFILTDECEQFHKYTDISIRLGYILGLYRSAIHAKFNDYKGDGLNNPSKSMQTYHLNFYLWMGYFLPNNLYGQTIAFAANIKHEVFEGGGSIEDYDLSIRAWELGRLIKNLDKEGLSDNELSVIPALLFGAFSTEGSSSDKKIDMFNQEFRHDDFIKQQMEATNQFDPHDILGKWMLQNKDKLGGLKYLIDPIYKKLM